LLPRRVPGLFLRGGRAVDEVLHRPRVEPAVRGPAHLNRVVERPEVLLLEEVAVLTRLAVAGVERLRNRHQEGRDLSRVGTGLQQVVEDAEAERAARPEYHQVVLTARQSEQLPVEGDVFRSFRTADQPAAGEQAENVQ